MKLSGFKKSRLFLTVLACLFLYFLYMVALYTRRTDIYFNNGSILRIQRPNLINLFNGAYYQVDYQPSEGQTGTFKIWSDSIDDLILIMPVGNTKALFCLYQFDGDDQLIYINPEHKFNSLPSDLKGIIATSWEVRDAELTEWIEALHQLKAMSAMEGRQITNYGPIDWGDWGSGINIPIQNMEAQIRKMQEGGTSRWPVIESNEFPITNFPDEAINVESPTDITNPGAGWRPKPPP